MVTLSGIATLVSWLSERADSPILVIPLGITTLVNPSSLNALLPMLTTGNPMMVAAMVSSEGHVAEHPVTVMLPPLFR